MRSEEIKAAINGAETRRHQAWQAGDTKAAADLAAQIDLLWDAWRHTQRPYHAVERSEEHTSELQSRQYLVCRLLLEKKKNLDSTAPSRFSLMSAAILFSALATAQTAST